MKNKKILFILVVCGLLAILLPSLTFAATLDNPLGKNVTVQTLIGRVISAVLGIVGSIALLMFIYGGFLWLTSSGNEQRITQGKNVLVWATIGLAIIFLSYTMVSFVIQGIKSGGTTGPGSAGGVDVEGGGMTIQGCCVVGGGTIMGGSCYAASDTECKNGSFNATSCNNISSCQSSTAGCCRTNAGCTDTPTQTDCKGTFGPTSSFTIGAKCSPQTGQCIFP